MFKKRFFLVWIVVIGSWLVWTSVVTARDRLDVPANVGLLYFTADDQADGVHLEWGTATELNTAGFIIQRQSGSGSFVTLDGIGFVDSTGGIATGATYNEIDTTAVVGQTYTYKLVEIEIDSSEHDLETVTITFDPQPTATAVIIGGTNPTETSTSSSSAATATRTPTATSTAVSTQSTSQPTAAPQITGSPQATASTNTTASQSTATRPLPATAVPILDSTFEGNNTGSGSPETGVVLAQEEATPAAYPGPETFTAEPGSIENPFPPEQTPGEITPENPTPYPAVTQVQAAPTLAVIGSDDPYPAGVESTSPPVSPDVIRGRILLWIGFLVAFFIFLSGVIGAIVLYRRRPA